MGKRDKKQDDWFPINFCISLLKKNAKGNWKRMCGLLKIFQSVFVLIVNSVNLEKIAIQREIEKGMRKFEYSLYIHILQIIEREKDTKRIRRRMSNTPHVFSDSFCIIF